MKSAIGFLLGLVAACAARPHPPWTPATRQLVVGTTAGWDATEVVLRRYERDPGGAWRPVGAPWPAVTGRAGLAWGLGLHHDVPAGPTKREGDGRAAAGAFTIGAAYGYEPSAATRVPYAQLGPSWRCVDDPRSSRYDQVFDAAGVPTDWTSAEEMRRADELYALVLVIDHNPAPPVPGAGSCIFFHVWSGPASVTAGCTAMERPRLEDLLTWLDPSLRPVYVLLPAPVYRELARPWGLP